jgi:hypothetical protein
MWYHIINEIKQFVDQNPGIHFGFFSKIDHAAINTIATGPEFIFIDQSPAVHHEIEVLAPEFVQFGTQCLEDTRYRNRFLNCHRNIADPELNRIEKRMNPQIPPDLFRIVDTVGFHQQFYIIIIIFNAVEKIGYACTWELLKYFVRNDLYPVCLPSQKGELVLSANTCGRK